MRKELTLTIDAAGRDSGKVFHIREMGAAMAERWAARALVALVGNGASIPQEVISAGVSGLASLGVQALAGLSWDKVQPLYDELMTCVAVCPNPEKPSVRVALTPDTLDAYVEEVATLVRLRAEVVALHLGFSLEGFNLTSITDKLIRRVDLQTTSTSPGL